jgi:hypothetical protein
MSKCILIPGRTGFVGSDSIEFIDRHSPARCAMGSTADADGMREVH